MKSSAPARPRCKVYKKTSGRLCTWGWQFPCPVHRLGSGSRLRHKYQLATVQYGRHRSASFCISGGLGNSSSPYALRIAARIPRSPTGRMSVLRSANIRNMCAVHSPIPFTAVRRSITSSSASVGSSSNMTSPSRVWRAKSRMYAVFCADRPSFRMRAGRNFSTFGGVRLPPTAAARRPKITEATFPLSCW